MAFFCISCKSAIEPRFKACPFCGEPITEFLRRYLEQPIDGKYQIISRLGIGGMGEVYKVLHIHLNSIRVIKLMRPNIASEEGSHDRFVREARLATKINHPNVASLYDFATLDDGSYYMVWEYIEGTNLNELLRAHGCLSPKYAAQLAYQGLMGLDAIHRAGVVHRDISPENLMLTKDEEGEERIKIIDLGIAKQWGDAADDKTKTGMFVGKWKYCSPEHLGMLKDGERIDGRADLYSFGIVLYELLTGAPPFIADSPHRYLLLHASESPKPLTVSNPGVKATPELEAAIFKSLEKDRGNRYTTAREFAKKLETLIPALEDTAAIPIITDLDEESTEERPSFMDTVAGTTQQTVGAGSASTASTENLKLANATVRDGSALRTVDEATEHQQIRWKPASQRTLDKSATPTYEQPARRSNAWMGAVAAGLVIAVVVVMVMMSSNKKSEVAKLPSGSVVASTMTAAENAQLGMNAFPWAEVIYIKNLKNGQSLEINERMVTPTSIDLPPGSYEIVMQNPSFGKPVTRTVELSPGEREVLMIEFTTPKESSYPSFEGTFR